MDAIGLARFDEDSYYQDPLGFFVGLRESRPVAPVLMSAYGRAWIALGALLARFPRISLAVQPEELRRRPVSLMNGLESLPIRLT